MIDKPMPVHNSICQVISLLQTQCLAMDTALDADAMWGVHHMPSGNLELAIKLLIGVLEDVERI